MRYFIKRFLFVLIFCFISFVLMLFLFKPIFNISSLVFPHCVHPFDICIRFPSLWNFLKILYISSYLFSNILIFNSLGFQIIHKTTHLEKKKVFHKSIAPQNSLQLLVGLSSNNEHIIVPEKGLYQNFLITRNNWVWQN